MADSYVKGELVRVSMAYTDTDGDAIDPSTVSIRIKPPSGTRVTYVYGTDAELVKDSVGNYHVDLSLAEDGEYRYYAWSTGTGQAAVHGRVLSVEPLA